MTESIDLVDAIGKRLQMRFEICSFEDQFRCTQTVYCA